MNVCIPSNALLLYVLIIFFETCTFINALVEEEDVSKSRFMYKQ